MSTVLSLEKVSAGYGDVAVLHEVDLEVGEGEMVSVVGANGAGKTTLLCTISGLTHRLGGKIGFGGTDISSLKAHRVVNLGIAHVPEGGRLFPFMTVQENLELGAFSRSARPGLKAALDEVFELFPVLAERRAQLAGSLSGGERMMCAVARAVMRQPKLMMLDEPSAGLSPLMVEKLFALVASLVRAKQIAVLLVEQNVADALEMAQRGYVVERGRMVKSGAGSELLADPDVQKAYLGL